MVTLKDEGAAYSVSLIEPEVALSHKVLEIGDDYVILMDIDGVKNIVVPVNSVKAFEKVRLEVE